MTAGMATAGASGSGGIQTSGAGEECGAVGQRLQQLLRVTPTLHAQAAEEFLESNRESLSFVRILFPAAGRTVRIRLFLTDLVECSQLRSARHPCGKSCRCQLGVRLSNSKFAARTSAGSFLPTPNIAARVSAGTRGTAVCMAGVQ